VENETAFLCGAQGPDFLLIHRGFPWQLGRSLMEAGRKIHWLSPSRFLEAARDFLVRSPEKDAARSYLLGFLSHYAFDRTAHPYVYSQIEIWQASNPKISKSECHARIETALDVIMLRYLRGQTPLDLPLKRIYPRLPEGEGEIAAMLAFALRQAFGESAPEALLLQAMNDFRLSQRLLNDPTLLKKPFMERLERLFKASFPVSSYIRPLSEGEDDFANVQHDPWQNPYEDPPQKHTEDFFALYDRAYTLSVSLIDGFRKSLADPSLDLYSLTGDISYETGLPAKPEDYRPKEKKHCSAGQRSP